MNLNEKQIEAIQHMDGPCVVTSCPGSGKTLTLVERITYLIEQGVRPQNILCITFTNKAAKEMKERICKRLNIKKVNFFIGTFHSLCANILRKFAVNFGINESFTILDENDQLSLINKIARKKGYEIEKGDTSKISYILNTYRDQLHYEGYLDDELKNRVFINIAYEYLDICKKNGVIDFSGLIYDTIKYLEEEKNRNVREMLQNGFKYILVDETQDTNGGQYHLINLLGNRWKNIMIIGDPNQSIYFFRGAKYTNIQDFIDLYPDCRIISLTKNYRSTPQIVEVADKLIKNNPDRISNLFETDNPSGEPVRCLEMLNQDVEANWIATQIKKLIQEGGWKPEDIAVLYRLNKMSEPIEQSLSRNGVSYEVVGGFSFYDRKEVKDCLSLLRFLVNHKDSNAFVRVCSLIKGLGAVTIGKIEEISSENNIDILEAIKQYKENSKSIKINDACNKLVNIFSAKYDFSKPGETLVKLINGIGLQDQIKALYPDTYEDRVDNVRQVVEASNRFDGNIKSIDMYLQQISLVSSSDKEIEGGKVSLMSVHSAKGLEFPVCFLPGLEKNILPHIRAITETDEGIYEERRIFYVAATRAKKLLYITYCKSRLSFGKFGNKIKKDSGPSVFLFESGLLKKEK